MLHFSENRMRSHEGVNLVTVIEIFSLVDLPEIRDNLPR